MMSFEKTKLDRVLGLIYRIFGIFALVCFCAYTIKLLFSPEGLLPPVACAAVICGVTVPALLNKKLRVWLRCAYLPLKALMCAALVFYAVTFSALVGYIYLSPSEDVVAASQSGGRVYIVFGAKVKSYGPTATLAARLDAAVDAMERDGDSVCIVTGGQGIDEPTTEAEAMKDYMVSRGIDSDRIYMEAEAHDTRDNIKFSMALMEKEGLSGRRVVCVSSDTHIPRIRLMCSEAGLDAGFIKAESPKKEYLFTTWVREYLSYCKMLLGY